MQIIRPGEEFPTEVTKTIFLAGPTPRSSEVASWRPRAIALLKKAGFDGTVYSPEREGEVYPDYDDQIDWEAKALSRADCILFWIPRDIKTMPGLTTNHEHGEWFDSGKCVLGAPPGAISVRYLFAKAKSASVPTSRSLDETVENAIAKVGQGSPRNGSECQVPLHVWKTRSFQRWYGSQKECGNGLVDAEVLYSFPMGSSDPFLWIVKVAVAIAAENGRVKSNEFVLARPDTCTVILHSLPGTRLIDTQVVIVKEFRSPASVGDCYVREFPGGSVDAGSTPEEAALHEVEQETGLKIGRSRLVRHTVRQAVATLSSHVDFLFSVMLKDEEIEAIRKAGKAGIKLGVTADTEVTMPSLATFGEIMSDETFDRRSVGQVSEVLMTAARLSNEFDATLMESLRDMAQLMARTMVQDDMK